MGIFDAISGNAYKQAAKNNAAMIQQGVTAGANALTAGANAAVDTLGTRGAGTALQQLGQGYSQARNDLLNGYTKADPALSRLGALYDPMVQGGRSAYSAYSDAIGANGAAGSDRAQAAFRAGPGYEFQRDQALEAIQRSAAARGGLAGGNATRDLLTTATGLADQSWDSYVSNLQNGSNFYTQGLAGKAQGLTAQAGAPIARGQQLAQLGQSSGRDQAAIFNSAAGVQSGLGQGVANLWGQATANTIANNNQLAAGQTNASGSLLGGLLGGAQSLFGAVGQAGGFSNLFK